MLQRATSLAIIRRAVLAVVSVIAAFAVLWLPARGALAAEAPPAAKPPVILRPALLVLNKGDATMSVVHVPAAQTFHVIPVGEGPHEVEVTEDGRFAVVTNYGTGAAPGSTLSVIDIGTVREPRKVPLGELLRPHGLSRVGNRVYFTSEANRSIGRYDPATDTVDWTFPTGQDGTHMVVANRDESVLFTANMGSNSISIIERSASGTARQTLVPVGDGPEGLDLSPDGTRLWTAHSRDGGLSIIDVVSRTVIGTMDLGTRRSNRVKFTPDGQRVLVSDLGSGELLIIDAAARRVLKRLPVGQGASGILVRPDGVRAYVALSQENAIAIVDLQRLTVVGRIPTGASPDGMAWVE